MPGDKVSNGKERSKKHVKGLSLQSGIANLLLSSTTSLVAGAIGFEYVVHNKMINCVEKKDDPTKAMMKYVADNIIGKDLVYEGPFGARRGKNYQEKIQSNVFNPSLAR